VHGGCAQGPPSIQLGALGDVLRSRCHQAVTFSETATSLQVEGLGTEPQDFFLAQEDSVISLYQTRTRHKKSVP